MVRNIGIKDSLYEKLSQEKGERSFSWIIEQYVNKTPVVLPAKDELRAASQQPIKGVEPTCNQ